MIQKNRTYPKTPPTMPPMTPSVVLMTRLIIGSPPVRCPRSWSVILAPLAIRVNQDRQLWQEGPCEAEETSIGKRPGRRRSSKTSPARHGSAWPDGRRNDGRSGVRSIDRSDGGRIVDGAGDVRGPGRGEGRRQRRLLVDAA